MKQKSILKMRVTMPMLALVFLASCVKDRGVETDFSGLSPIVQIKEGGLDQFKNAALLFPAADLSDTAYFRINYAATTVAPRDIKVTLAYDAAALTAYNATLPASQQYAKFPDSIYSFTQTTVTVKAGQSYSDVVKLTVYPYKVDVSKSYMFPITITAADGVNISGNFGTIYYHFIGNPLAGNYQDYGVRWSATGSLAWSGPAASLGLATSPGVPCVNPPAPLTCAAPTTVYNYVTVFAPVNSQTVSGVMGNVPDPSGGSAYWYVTGNATFSAITLDVASTFRAGYSNIDLYTRGYIAPSPTQKPAFRLITKYNNTTGGAGNDRIIDESFTHQ